MRLKFVQKIIDKIRGRNCTKCIFHKKYGRIYLPFYHYKHKLEAVEHDIYNSDGQKMRTFFIRDIHFAHNQRMESKYFIWDRYNIGLNTHFYTHNSMLQTMGNPARKYGVLIESETIVPEDYNIFKKHKGLEKDFDLIFTYSDRILQTVDNARLVPLNAFNFAKEFDDTLYLRKSKNISMLSSNKAMCDMHKFRINLAYQCKNSGLVDTFGTFDGGARVPDDAEVFKDYRYAVCVENDITPYYFTERLMLLFALQTVPVYLGATKIDKFFNPDGIIQINKNSDIEKVLKMCTKEEYERRLPAISENYEKSKKYANPFDYMAEKYLSDICYVNGNVK
ncbi:hypothetical protein J6P92_07170 [bacterium]|nr:hypothetical protein [bacterium]